MTLTDDILATRKPKADVMVHKPAEECSLEPACAAAATEPYHRFGAYVARMENACLCRNCFPLGWSTET